MLLSACLYPSWLILCVFSAHQISFKHHRCLSSCNSLRGMIRPVPNHKSVPCNSLKSFSRFLGFDFNPECSFDFESSAPKGKENSCAQLPTGIWRLGIGKNLSDEQKFWKKRALIFIWKSQLYVIHNSAVFSFCQLVVW